MGPDFKPTQNHFQPVKEPEIQTVPLPQSEAEPVPDATNPYHFILDTDHQKKKGFKPMKSASNSLVTRLLIVFGAGLGVIIVILIISKLAFGSKASNGALLTSLAAEQQEIVRVADLGVAGTGDPTVAAYAQTIRSSVASEQISLVGYLKLSKIKFTNAALAADKNIATDSALAQATASNQFDSVFTATIKTSLTTYSTDLKKDYDSESNPTSKSLLKGMYDSTTTLLKD